MECLPESRRKANVRLGPTDPARGDPVEEFARENVLERRLKKPVRNEGVHREAVQKEAAYKEAVRKVLVRKLFVRKLLIKVLIRYS